TGGAPPVPVLMQRHFADRRAKMRPDILRRAIQKIFFRSDAQLQGLGSRLQSCLHARGDGHSPGWGYDGLSLAPLTDPVQSGPEDVCRGMDRYRPAAFAG